MTNRSQQQHRESSVTLLRRLNNISTLSLLRSPTSELACAETSSHKVWCHQRNCPLSRMQYSHSWLPVRNVDERGSSMRVSGVRRHFPPGHLCRPVTKVSCPSMLS